MQVIKSDFLISHPSPYKLKQHCQNHASYLRGLEHWLTQKFGFNVKLFTLQQKEYLRCNHIEESYMMGNQLIVGPRTYEQLLKLPKGKLPL
jgi:hypothetical protein